MANICSNDVRSSVTRVPYHSNVRNIIKLPDEVGSFALVMPRAGTRGGGTEEK